MLLGAALTLCNIYTGLKVGWGTSVSITAVLLGYGFWRAVPGSRRPFGIFENNLNQTAASAAASMSSAGLVSAMPALTLLTGQTLSFAWLTVWVFVVSVLGVAVGAALRRQLIEVDKLPFPFGMATAETLKEIYAKGTEAILRVKALLGGAAVAALLKVAEELFKLPKWGLPASLAARGALAQKGVAAISLKNLGFAIEPSLLMVGLGALIGTRACLSVLLGAVAGWGFIAPELLARGLVAPGKPGDVWFGPMVQWMLWPGVGMMVAASLTSFLLSLPGIVRGLTGSRTASRTEEPAEAGYDVDRRTLLVVLAGIAVAAIAVQLHLFRIPWYGALFGVALTFVLAIVAGRVSGETGITPVGPMGKVTQLAFGIVTPGDATSNLMAANVTGGAASHCGDILHDLKTGQMIGAWPRPQAVAQLWGVLAGSLAGSAAYLVLIPDPKKMLLTNDWPAPAVAQWKAVAELFQKGLSTMPAGALTALLVAAGIGVVLALIERYAPKKVKPYLPSPTSVGLALVIPANNSVMIAIGGIAAALVSRRFPGWAARFVVVIASGLIAGESLTGVVFALKKMIGG